MIKIAFALAAGAGLTALLATAPAMAQDNFSAAHAGPVQPEYRAPTMPQGDVGAMPGDHKGARYSPAQKQFARDTGRQMLRDIDAQIKAATSDEERENLRVRRAEIVHQMMEIQLS